MIDLKTVRFVLQKHPNPSSEDYDTRIVVKKALVYLSYIYYESDRVSLPTVFESIKNQKTPPPHTQIVEHLSKYPEYRTVEVFSLDTNPEYFL